ncbi:MAG: DUF2837 family protein [Chitinophagaceae bacterium]
MLSNRIVLVCILTAVIHLIGISSLSARIVGTRTKRLASSTSLFNIIILFSQFANTIQAPLLTKFVETNIILQHGPDNSIFRLIIFSSTIGAILGALSIPTLHRFMEKGVNAMYKYNSVFMVVIKSLKVSTITHFKDSFKIPLKDNFLRLGKFQGLKMGIILLNIIVYAFITVSVLSCLYSGYLNPSLRTTSLSMSGIASGLGAVGMLLFIEPYNAILTDKVIEGSVSEAYFRRHLSLVILAKIIGTMAGQFLFIPLAHIITNLASLL